MNIYLRKILKHDITHQISVTNEVLNGFFGIYNDKESAIIEETYPVMKLMAKVVIE